MSTFKKLNKQDAYITTYTAKKQWAVSGSTEFSASGIFHYPGVSGSGPYIPTGSDLQSGQHPRLIYQSIYQLYYSGFTNGIPSTGINGLTGSSFENYLQSSYNVSGSRNIANYIEVLSIPRKLLGTHIEPSSFSMNPSGSSLQILLIGNILDDGEGNLYISGSSPIRYVGNIIYTHGQVIITDSFYYAAIGSYISGSMNWKSNQPIYTYNYHCRLRETEFNFTYNISAQSASLRETHDNNGDTYSTSSRQFLGNLSDNITGSAFQPYITAVGLYNDSNELIAVGKMNQPVPKSANTEMTFIVKMDI